MHKSIGLKKVNAPNRTSRQKTKRTLITKSREKGKEKYDKRMGAVEPVFCTYKKYNGVQEILIGGE